MSSILLYYSIIPTCDGAGFGFRYCKLTTPSCSISQASSLTEDAVLPATEDLALRAERSEGCGTGGGLQVPLEPASLVGTGLRPADCAPLGPAGTPPAVPGQDWAPAETEGEPLAEAARSQGYHTDTLSVFYARYYLKREHINGHQRSLPADQHLKSMKYTTFEYRHQILSI